MKQGENENNVTNSPKETPVTPVDATTRLARVPNAPMKTTHRRLRFDNDIEPANKRKKGSSLDLKRFVGVEPVQFHRHREKRMIPPSSNLVRLHGWMIARGFEANNLQELELFKRALSTPVRDRLLRAISASSPSVAVKDFTLSPNGERLETATLNLFFYGLLILANRAERYGDMPCHVQAGQAPGLNP